MSKQLFLRMGYKVVILFKRFFWKLEYGKSLRLGQGVVFRNRLSISITGQGTVEIGDRTFFNNGCSINGKQRIVVGCDCLFGEDVKIYDHNHRFNTREMKISQQGYSMGTVEIGNNCWICSNVIILKGAKIGNNCVISAGCIIDLEIPDDSIVKMRNKEITVESINYQ